MKKSDLPKILDKKKLTLAVAESCTGGLIAHTLTNRPGSSSTFLFGICPYSNQLKVRILGIRPKTIKLHGAVSQETAIDMSRKIRLLSKASVGLSVTGIAGPTGGSANKPVGTVFIAVSLKRKVYFKKFQFKGSRLQIKEQARDAALRLLTICLSD